jgi:rapamycin-insensitive companion of mTOR
MYLCTNDMLAIRSLVDTLRIPNMDTREIILDMFFEVLNIKPVEWYRAFLDGRRLTSKFSSAVPS